MTTIEWTEATWNPIAGCSLLSPGCTNCFAMRIAARLARIEATAPIYAGLTHPSKAGPVWTGRIEVNEKALLEPLRRRKPTMYFVNSMSDLFHESVPDETIDRIFAAMALCPQHTLQVLTKRSARMREYMQAAKSRIFYTALEMAPVGRDISGAGLVFAIGGSGSGFDKWPLPNVWLGVSVEDQKRADERIPDLLATPAAVRFLSCEPLLGPVDLESAWHGENALQSDCWGECRWCDENFPPLHNCQWNRQSEAESRKGRSGIDWVIVGGESGPGARPMHPDWARALRDQCAAADVPFFFKQWGQWAPICEMTEEQIDACYHPAPISRPDASRRLRRKQCVLHADGERFDGEAMFRRPAFEQGSGAMTMMAIGKKAAGRTLDGVTHDAMPEACA